MYCACMHTEGCQGPWQWPWDSGSQQVDNCPSSPTCTMQHTTYTHTTHITHIHTPLTQILYNVHTCRNTTVTRWRIHIYSRWIPTHFKFTQITHTLILNAHMHTHTRTHTHTTRCLQAKSQVLWSEAAVYEVRTLPRCWKLGHIPLSRTVEEHKKREGLCCFEHRATQTLSLSSITTKRLTHTTVATLHP